MTSKPPSSSRHVAPSKEGSSDASVPASPVVTPRRQTRISWIWLVPLVAALAGASLLVRDWMRAGPVVTIRFETAEGLEVGQTRLRYRDVNIGLVSGIQVAPDRSSVLVHAQLDRDGSEYVTRKETRFWVVRPRLGVSGVSGLGTLLSGAYISVDTPSDPPSGSSSVVTEFVGLEKPPEVASTRPGSRFTLHASELGSFEIGSPVYFRRIQVGQVIGYDLDATGSAVNVQVFVDKPHDQFVTRDARFWNSSGIQASFGADGFQWQMASVAAMISGGISFSPAGDWDVEPAPQGTAFVLAPNRPAAMADPDGPPFQIELHFSQSVRGLKVGAPVDFRGLELGRVVDIDLEFDEQAKRFFALVTADIYPLRFGQIYEELAREHGSAEFVGETIFAPMIRHGLRAQMRAANILTGQQYVALDFFSEDNASPVVFDAQRQPLLMPTISGDFDRLQQQISSIVTKIDAVPFQGIGEDLRTSLQSFGKLADRIGKELTPQASAMLKSARQSLDAVTAVAAPDSGMQQSVGNTLRELENAARSLRSLADYLQTRPDALIRGRAPDVLPPPGP